VIGERDFSSRRRPRGIGRGDVLLLAAGVLLLAAAGASAGSAWADLRRARASLEEARRVTADSEAKARALAMDAGPEGSLGARAIWTLEAPPPRVVATVAAALPADVRLESIVLRYGSELEVEMVLTARSAAAYDLFLEGLERSGAFTGIAPGNESRGDEVRASVRARFRGGEP
jgi:hypothetical protein